jgi:hypothetical protein
MASNDRMTGEQRIGKGKKGGGRRITETGYYRNLIGVTEENNRILKSG